MQGFCPPSKQKTGRGRSATSRMRCSHSLQREYRSVTPAFRSFPQQRQKKGNIWVSPSVFEKGHTGRLCGSQGGDLRPDWFPSAEERTRQQCRSVCAFCSGFHSSSEDTSAMLQSSFGIDHIHLVPTLRETIPAMFFLASFTVRREIFFLPPPEQFLRRVSPRRPPASCE